jgi:hypothetical protein
LTYLREALVKGSIIAYVASKLNNGEVEALWALDEAVYESGDEKDACKTCCGGGLNREVLERIDKHAGMV